MYHYHTFNNGIRLIFSPNNSAVTHCGVFINVGSRDETGPDEGMAHFIEHSIFKGTSHRRAWHILNRIDGVGGELNAFTTKEETCVYASALNQYLERCLELISDILFHSTFPDKEIEKEKEVVMEEIDSYKDSPAELIFDDFEELAFEGHPLAHNILGSKKNVSHFTTGRLRTFMMQNYTTRRMVITVVGKANFAHLIKLCDKYFGQQTAADDNVTRAIAPVYHPFSKTIHRRTHQVHAMMGCPAVNVFDNRKTAFSLLNNLIGGPAMNSCLNMNIREKHGFCYTIESQFTPLSDAGLFYVYAGIEHDTQERFFEMVRKQLLRFRDNKLSTRQLHAAKQQYIGQMAINNEVSVNEMQSIGKCLLAFEQVDTLEEMQHEIEAVTADDICQLAGDLFNPDAMSYIVYC